MPRGGRQNPFQSTFWNIQNDYAYELKTRHVNSTTLAGVAVNHFDNSSRSIVVTGGAVDFDNLASYPRTVTVGAVSNNQYTERDDRQLYLSETLGLLDDRLILNASNSWSAYDYSVLNRLTGVKQVYDPTTRQFAYGVVAKPLSNVALFYSSSEQKSPQNPFSIAVGQKPIQTGRQSEFGVRLGLMDKKLIVTLSHFDIEQDNFAITNPGNLAVPPPVPLLPPLIADLTSKGWEFEFSGYLTPQLTVLGNYTDYRMRDAFGVRQRAVPDRSAGIWLHYEFADVSALHGLSLGLGANHLGERAGDQVSGLAAGSTPAAPIPNQPTFYLPARTLVDASVGYKFSRNWHAQLNVANLLNTDYIAASASRYIVFPGATINARLRITYTF
jgi:iron complex outermembrane receptor protein